MNHTIFVLGPSGSGKTTFFASLFKRLSLAGEHNFFLKPKAPQARKQLVDLYERLANSGEWPTGTRNFSRWKFDCYVQNSDQTKVKVGGLSLFDYKGGFVTDQAESDEDEDEDNFNEAIQRASAILAILDGQKVLAFMQDKDLLTKEVITWMERDLSNVLQMVEDFDGHLPLHFVICKWDVIEEEGNYSLIDIKQRLFEKVPSLRNLIERRYRANYPAYFIPVSAVGRGFATFRNGRMEKNPGTIPLPSRLEVPLALSLADLHKDVVTKQSVKTLDRKRNNFSLSLVLYFLVGLAMIIFLGIWGLLLLGGYMLFRLINGSKNKANRSMNSEASAQAVSSEDAFHQLLDECRQIRDNFLRQFPEARCTEIKQGVKA